MNNTQGTSFIPQRPTKKKAGTRRIRKIYVVAYLSYIFFFGSLLAAAGVFFFDFSVDLQLEKQKELLASERELFDQSDIESIRDLEKRIDVAQKRIDNHVSVLAILEALEKSAVQSLRYERFTYMRNNDDFPLVTFSGDTSRFDSVIFQREVLAENPILEGSRITEVEMQSLVDALNPNNTQKMITFTLEKEIDTGSIGYTPRTVRTTQTQESVQNQTQTQTQTDTIEGEPESSEASNNELE